MLDLDHFKTITDSHGHLVGAVVLKEVANRICHVVRPYVFVGRYGGEEFLVILPGCNRSKRSKLGKEFDRQFVRIRC